MSEFDQKETLTDDQLIEIMKQGVLPQQKVTFEQWKRVKTSQDIIHNSELIATDLLN